MLYQNLLTGKIPYAVWIGKMICFPLHKHPEIELNYCIKGSYDVIIDKNRFTMREGDLAIINSMVSHETPVNPLKDQKSLNIEVGPILLGEDFNMIASSSFPNKIFHLDENEYPELYKLFKETAELSMAHSDFS